MSVPSEHDQADPQVVGVETATTSSWWRHQRVALIALVVLVPLTAFVIVGNAVRYDRATNPTDPIAVRFGASTTYGGATVGPIAATATTDSAEPGDTKVIRVTIPIANGTSLNCWPPDLTEVSGSRRTWKESSSRLADTDFSTITYCDSTRTDPYEIELSYLVPADAVAPFSIEFYDDELLPSFVNFELPESALG